MRSSEVPSELWHLLFLAHFLVPYSQKGEHANPLCRVEASCTFEWASLSFPSPKVCARVERAGAGGKPQSSRKAY